MYLRSKIGPKRNVDVSANDRKNFKSVMQRTKILLQLGNEHEIREI